MEEKEMKRNELIEKAKINKEEWKVQVLLLQW